MNKNITKRTWKEEKMKAHVGIHGLEGKKLC
jgi:hypothetical protein